MYQINILHLVEGAKQAEGLTVIIDVFRAFSLECYLYDLGVKEIRPVGTIEEAFSLSSRIQNSILIGERQGRKCDGFDYGNSPSTISKEDVAGKTIIHTTSAGTQGVVNAVGASEIITGSLVNAKAVARYIMTKHPQTVSLVCMGKAGMEPAAEDELCAEYIKSILEGKEFSGIKQKVLNLKSNAGRHFFDQSSQDVFPEADFWMCIDYNRFPFVIKVEKDELGLTTRKEEMFQGM
ncbi:MAG: 2-phosphosulfolactate phosphatase [Lachnospiraceae bacterium]|nr:2-phosphosulfolactate phosphatase [Lachnospiraceae bacterium]